MSSFTNTAYGFLPMMQNSSLFPGKISVNLTTHSVLDSLDSLGLPTILAVAVPTYLIIVRHLRWRRYDAIHRKYLPKFQAGQELTPEEAQEIMQVPWRYDMPRLLGFSLAFALFKTYGIPTISKLLAATKELKSAENVSKRYIDTQILISTWQACPISGRTDKGEEDPRANVSIARVNWLHSKYNIKNEDYLYTLALFTFEPERFAKEFGWRELSPLECEAFFVFWKEVGKRMGIKDIPETAEEFKRWTKEYEDQYMVPAQTNKEVAFYTTEELVHNLPEAFGIKNLARKLVVCMLAENVRVAMMLPPASSLLRTVLFTVLKSQAIFDRYVGFPRLRVALPIDPDIPDLSGEGFPSQIPCRFLPKPWYKPRSRWALGRFVDRLMVRLGQYDDVPGEKWRSGGYRLDNMGPLKFENQGIEEVIRMAEKIQGCPISSAWKGEKN